MISDDPKAVIFSIEHCNRYVDLPLDIINNLPISVHIIDYNWTYLYINKNSLKVLGDSAEHLIGKNALEVFKDSRFKTIFERIQKDVVDKKACNTIIYSPLGGGQISIKGYPLEDCYYFSLLILPSKDELLEELRKELNRYKSK